MSADGAITFKDWLPDQPDLNNPGLTQAQNTLPVSGSFMSYAPLATSGNTAGGTVQNALRVTGEGGDYVYVGVAGISDGKLMLGAGSAGSWTNLSAATMSPTGTWDLAQYEEGVIATNGVDLPIYHTLGSASFATTLGSTSGTAPAARHVGIVGQFVVLGQLSLSATPYAVRWSGIDQPLSWPTPNSSTAIAQQSGQQNLDPQLGNVNGIFGGDQFGVILQAGGVTRMTYVGGSVVFQFDQIDRGSGCPYQNGAIKVGGLVYFASQRGFCVTDGVSVKPIGSGMVDDYFRARVASSFLASVIAGADYAHKLIYWTFSTNADAGNPSSALVYNYEENRWALIVDTVRFYVRGSSSQYLTYGFEAFGNDNKLGRFTGTPGNAIFASAEMEPNPGGFSRVKGIKPLVDQANITIAMGTRNDRTSAVSYTSEVTPNTRSGFSDFRSEARYHRARLTIAGTFNAAQGLEYQAAISGAT